MTCVAALSLQGSTPCAVWQRGVRPPASVALHPARVPGYAESQACPCRKPVSAARGRSALWRGGWVMVNASEAISFKLRCRLLRQVSGDIYGHDLMTKIAVSSPCNLPFSPLRGPTGLSLACCSLDPQAWCSLHKSRLLPTFFM